MNNLNVERNIEEFLEEDELMKNVDVLILLSDIYKKSKKYGDETENLDPSLNGIFNEISNTLLANIEILHYYYLIWITLEKNGVKGIKDENGFNLTQQENAEKKIILIQKWGFISTLSELEARFKTFIKKFPNKIGNCKNPRGEIYLSNIIKKSKENLIIDEDTKNKWLRVIYLRNYLVHNNGIAEKNDSCIFPKCKLVFEENKMIQGDLKLFFYLTDWILDATKDLVLAISKK